jgi:hypothetical protein
MAGLGEQVFGRKGNDMLFGALGDQLYGDDIILLGGGNSLGDGGSGDDVLKGGLGHSLLVDAGGNDKLLTGPSDTVMDGGGGANHFECPKSTLGLATSYVLDYNPSNGDTISGQCTLVNNVGPSGGGNKAPQVNLPDTGEVASGTNTAQQGAEANQAAGG